MKVLIGAGHRHTLGEHGNPYEMELNGKKVRAILDLYDRSGGEQVYQFQLRCYTPDRGLGLYPGYLNQAPASGFPGYGPHLMVELHSEGVGDPHVRGGFAIYPDWAGDVDEDVRDHGVVFAETLEAATGIPVRWSSGRGVMSEKRTGVGLDGYRLGVFRDTAPWQATCSRTIFEQGSHSSPKDRAIMDSGDFLDKQAAAFLAGVTRFFDLTEPGWRASPPKYAKPVALPFSLKSDVGAQELNGLPVYLFKTVVTSLKRIIPRAYAGESAEQSADAIGEGEKVAIFGEVVVESGRKWYFLGDGSRVQARHFTPDIQIRHRG